MFSSAEDAETAFYDALSRADLEAMMQVWAEDHEVVCIHPDGPRLVGFGVVIESWRQIFATGTRLQVSVAQCIATGNPSIATHNVIELVSLHGKAPLVPPMIATNVYLNGPQGWKMIMHHASPAPELPLETDVEGERVLH